VPLKETFVSENLKDAGYDTALFGKWHLGFYQRKFTPLERGFDEHLGYFQGEVDYYKHTGGGYGGTPNGIDWHRGNQTACFDDTGNYTTELVVRKAIGYLKRKAATPSTPFFLYLPFHLIHGPNQVPQKYLDLYPVLNLTATARSQGMCGVCECAGVGSSTQHQSVGSSTQHQSKDALWKNCRTVLAMAAALDWAVGSVVDALKSNQQWGNTLIIYTSDNGAQGGQGGTSYPLRGWKTMLYEGGIRVPGE
jgi:arylsulfatase A-like enzyme